MRHFLTLEIHEGEAVLSPCVILVGGFAEPSGSLGVVLRHSLALVIHETETVLSLRVSLVGAFAVPVGSLGVVLRHSLTVVIHAGEVGLSFRVCLLGSYAACLRVLSELSLGGSRFDKMPSNCGPTDQSRTTNG